MSEYENADEQALRSEDESASSGDDSAEFNPMAGYGRGVAPPSLEKRYKAKATPEEIYQLEQEANMKFNNLPLMVISKEAEDGLFNEISTYLKAAAGGGEGAGGHGAQSVTGHTGGMVGTQGQDGGGTPAGGSTGGHAPAGPSGPSGSQTGGRAATPGAPPGTTGGTGFSNNVPGIGNMPPGYSVQMSQSNPTTPNFQYNATQGSYTVNVQTPNGQVMEISLNTPLNGDPMAGFANINQTLGSGSPPQGIGSPPSGQNTGSYVGAPSVVQTPDGKWQVIGSNQQVLGTFNNAQDAQRVANGFIGQLPGQQNQGQGNQPPVSPPPSTGVGGTSVPAGPTRSPTPAAAPSKPSPSPPPRGGDTRGGKNEDQFTAGPSPTDPNPVNRPGGGGSAREDEAPQIPGAVSHPPTQAPQPPQPQPQNPFAGYVQPANQPESGLPQSKPPSPFGKTINGIRYRPVTKGFGLVTQAVKHDCYTEHPGVKHEEWLGDPQRGMSDLKSHKGMSCDQAHANYEHHEWQKATKHFFR